MKKSPTAPHTPISSDRPRNARINFARILRLPKNFTLSRGTAEELRTRLHGGIAKSNGERRGIAAAPFRSARRHVQLSDRTEHLNAVVRGVADIDETSILIDDDAVQVSELAIAGALLAPHRSEEHTSELQSLRHLVCRLLL